jgi:hypothetical protein
MRNLIIILLFSLLTSGSLHAIGIVTIKGRIRAYKDFPFKTDKDEVSVTSFDPYTSIYNARIDNEGNFKLSFPKGFTGDVQFKFANNTPIQVIVSPGDRQYYLVEPMAIITIVSFSGDNALINQEIANYIKARTEIWKQNGHNERPFSMISNRIAELESPETFERKQAFLENYVQGKQLTLLFIQWARADINYNYASRIFHVKTNEHRPISDPAFFKQFPLDEPEALIASSYLTYLYVVRSSAIWGSPKVNVFIAYAKSPERTTFYNRLNAKYKKAFDVLFKYSDLSDSAMMANIKYPDSVAKYSMSKDDRFAVNYINNKTSGLVRDFSYANYMLKALRAESRWAPITYRYPMLITAYKKYVPDRRYLKILDEAYKTFKSNQKTLE